MGLGRTGKGLTEQGFHALRKVWADCVRCPVGTAVVEWHTPRWSSIIFNGGGVLRAGRHFKEMPAILAENPKWKDQVFRRIDTAAETNPEIAEMLAELKEKGPQPLFQSGPKTPF